jgi:phage gp29-like protein
MSKKNRRRATKNYLANPAQVHRQNTHAVQQAIGQVAGEAVEPEPTRRPVLRFDELDNRDRTDPARDFPDIPPNFGRSILPHVHTFQGLVSTVAKAYRNADEAIKHSLENSRNMRNDLTIMECLEQRQRVVAGLNWHLEVDGEETPYSKGLVERMTRILKLTPRFTEYRRTLLEAIWYGKQACENVFGFDIHNGQRDIYVKEWRPIMGDKIIFRQDYGDNAHPAHQVGLRVGPRWNAGDLIDGRRITPTESGLAVFLSEDERAFLTVHKHMIEDAAYENPLDAGAINGIGIRSRIYWTWYQKQELLALFMEYLERSALGFEIWYYDSGNPKGRADTEEAAKNRVGRRNIVLFPKIEGQDPTYGVEHIEPNAAGAESIQRVLSEFFGHAIKRYILGQTLSSEAGSTGLGSGVAELHLQTMLDILKYDATNLEETITRELLHQLMLYNDPLSMGVKLRFVIETENENMQERLDAYKAAFDMGARIKEKDVYEAIGSSPPEPGEPVLHASAGAAPGMAPPGAPGGDPHANPDPTQPPGEHHAELAANLREAVGEQSDNKDPEDPNKWKSAPAKINYARYFKGPEHALEVYRTRRLINS